MKGMSYVNKMYPCPYYVSTSIYNLENMYNIYRTDPYPYCFTPQRYKSNFSKQFINPYIPFTDGSKDNISIKLKDYGPEPFVVNITKVTNQNNTFRTALWTGNHLQLTLMSINVAENIGLEVHLNTDQFIRIDEGQGLVKMGDKKDILDFEEKVYDDFAIFIPAGKWHDIINTGKKPLKLYAIYAPPQHSKGTVHQTKEIAEVAEKRDNCLY